MSRLRVPGKVDPRTTVPDLPVVSDIRVRASSGVTKDGSDLISALANSGSLGGSFTPGSAPTWVDNVQNSKPVIRFDGTNDQLGMAVDSDDYALGTLALVVIPRATNTEGILEWSNSSNSGDTLRFVQRNGTDVRFYLRGASPDAYIYAIDHPTGEAHVYVFRFSTTSSRLWVDGVAETAGAGHTSDGNCATIYLGSGYPDFGQSDLLEFRLYDYEMGDSEAALVSAQLMATYGI